MVLQTLGDVDDQHREGRVNQLCENGHKAMKAGLNTNAANWFKTACALAPDRVDLVWQYAYAAADHDRAGIIEHVKAFIARNEGDPIAAAKAITIMLPYVESLEREKRGHSSYSADNAFERPFLYCDDLIADWGRKIAVWSDFGGHFSHVAAASHAFVTGDLDLCEMHLAEIRSAPMIDDRVRAARFNPAFYRDLEDIFDSRMPEMHVDMLSTHSRVVFVGCDWKYFQKHGPALCRSFCDNVEPKTTGLHLHIYDGPEFGELYTTIDGLMHRSFGLSTEGTPQVLHKNAKNYYASVRLIRMAQIMKRFQRPMLMVDADIIFNGSLDGVFAHLRPCDAVVCRMPGRIPFHTQFNASVFGVSPTQNGMRFIRQVAGYVRKSMLMRTVPWCLDQIAIMGCAYQQRRESGRHEGDALIQAVGPLVYDGSYNAVLAPQKVGPESPEYTKYMVAMEKYGDCAT